MASQQGASDLLLEQDLDFQRREWAIQRAAWLVFLAIVLAAVLGLFGSDGLVSDAAAGEKDGPLFLEYQRFERYHAPTELTVQVGPGVAREGAVRLWLDSGYAQGIEIESVLPEPEAVEVGSDRLTYVFQVSNPDEPTTIALQFRHSQFPRQRGRLGIDGGPELSFTQIVFP